MRSSRVGVKPTASTKRSPAKSATQRSNKSVPTSSVQEETPLASPEPQINKQPAIKAKPKPSLTTTLLRVLALLVVIGITVYIVSIKERVESFEAYGYPGIFLVALLANATVLVPAPGVAIIYAMGSVFNPLLVGFAAGTGGALGELSGYLAGFSGQAVIERTNIYERIMPWVDKYGGWAILILSAIPNPFFDIAGIAAGISKMRMRTFLISTWVGQLIKMTLFALAGKYSIEWIAKLIG